MASEQRELLAAKQNEQLLKLLEQNTELTVLVKELTSHIETLTNDVHQKVVAEK